MTLLSEKAHFSTSQRHDQADQEARARLNTEPKMAERFSNPEELAKLKNIIQDLEGDYNFSEVSFANNQQTLVLEDSKGSEKVYGFDFPLSFNINRNTGVQEANETVKNFAKKWLEQGENWQKTLDNSFQNKNQ